MRSAKADQSLPNRAGSLGNRRLLSAGQSYLERLGILYMDEIRLTIVMELYMREMGVQQFFETIGGSSYDSVRRHFLKLVEHGWLRRVRTVVTGRGRPEALYRATEQAVIDTDTWRTLPVPVRDAFTVMLLEEMASRMGEALEEGLVKARADRVAAFRSFTVDEQSWCEANDAIERCFQSLRQEQIDAKIRLESNKAEPVLMIVNLAAFEANGPQTDAKLALPKVEHRLSPLPWTRRIGKVFSDRVDLAILDELTHASMTPAELQATLGVTNGQGFLRRCKRLSDLGWTVNIASRTGGPLHGASLYHFRAASPAVSKSDIFERVPAAYRNGQSWKAFEKFVVTAIEAVDSGTFNNRFDRHLTMSPLLVDEIGWSQVTKALRTFEETVLRLEAHLERNPARKITTSFPAAFWVSSFQAPVRTVKQ